MAINAAQKPPSLIYSESFPLHAAAAAKLLQSCPTLCDPIDGSPPGSPVPGILQARTLLLLLLLSCFSRVRLCATPWTAAYQAPPSMGFSRQEYWSWVPLPSPRSSTESAKRRLGTETWHSSPAAARMRSLAAC